LCNVHGFVSEKGAIISLSFGKQLITKFFVLMRV